MAEGRDKYEFYLFVGNMIMADRDTVSLQNDGWELAGSVTPFKGNNGYNGLMIPFKRLIKEEDERG